MTLERRLSKIKEVPFPDALTIVEPSIVIPSGIPCLIRCPVPSHADKTPSCWIHDDHFYCFGCHVHGDIVDFIVASKFVRLKKAVRLAEKYLGISDTVIDEGEESLIDKLAELKKKPEKKKVDHKAWSTELYSISSSITSFLLPYLRCRDFVVESLARQTLDYLIEFIDDHRTKAPRLQVSWRNRVRFINRHCFDHIQRACREIESTTGKDRQIVIEQSRI